MHQISKNAFNILKQNTHEAKSKKNIRNNLDNEKLKVGVIDDIGVDGIMHDFIAGFTK